MKFVAHRNERVEKKVAFLTSKVVELCDAFKNFSTAQAAPAPPRNPCVRDFEVSAAAYLLP